MSKHGLMLFARNEEGRIIHVSEAERGKACRCTCPECGATVEAHKGDFKRHTFHHSAGEACGGGPETALHKFAKQTFEQAKRLKLPEVVARRPGVERWGFRGGIAEYCQVDVEPRDYDGIVPDAVGSSGHTRLFVEFAVTHPCPKEKAEKYRARGWNAVEIALNGVTEMMPDRPTAEDLRRLREAILYGSPRRWVHSERRRKLEEAFDREAAERVVSMRVGLTADDRKHREWAGAWTTIILLEEAKASAEMDALAVGGRAEIEMVRGSGLGAGVGVEVPGDLCMTLRREHWQALLLKAFWLEDAPRKGPGERFTLEDIEAFLRKSSLPEGMPLRPQHQMVDAVRKTVSDYRSPREVVVSYLHKLQALDLVDWSIGGWDPKRPLSQEPAVTPGVRV